MTYLCVHQSARNLDRRIARLRTILTGIGLGFIVIAAAGSWWFVGALVDRYESHLARSEARNRTLVQNSAPILVVDSAGQILGANPQAEDLFRAPKARLLDMTLRDLWLPDHREKVEDLFRTVASSDVVEGVDFDMRSSDGRAIPVDLRACRIDYEGREAVTSW